MVDTIGSDGIPTAAPLYETYLLLAGCEADAERYAIEQLKGRHHRVNAWIGKGFIKGRRMLWEARYVYDSDMRGTPRHERNVHHVALLLLPGHDLHLFSYAVQNWARRYGVAVREIAP